MAGTKRTKVFTGPKARHYHTVADCAGLLRGGGEVLDTMLSGDPLVEGPVMLQLKLDATKKDVEMTLCGRCRIREDRKAAEKAAAKAA